MSQNYLDNRFRASYFNISGESGFSTVNASLLVMIVVLIGLAGFVYQEGQTRLDLLERNLERIEKHQSIKQLAADEFKVELAKVSADAISQDAIVKLRLLALEENLEKVGIKVDKLEDSSSQEWLLSEIEYLMKMADHRILMKEDVKGAIALLKSAEHVIAKMPVADAGLNKVRVAIIKDITSMEVFKNIDVPGTYAQLVALGTLIETLPMVPLESRKAEEMISVEEKKNTFIDKVNSSIGEYLTIRRYDNSELEKMLMEDQRNGVRDNVLLSLEQAQTAILRGEQTIYDMSLNKVRTSLFNYFKDDDYRVDMAKVKLAKLMDVKIENQLPNVSGSQQELKRYLSDRMRVTQL